jgi:hypothetical protein
MNINAPIIIQTRDLEEGPNATMLIVERKNIQAPMCIMLDLL